ncbi:MAG: peptidyl-alpha-hydroxyglycine alpha-amidating lyase family protein [Ferruginibacter sp.]
MKNAGYFIIAGFVLSIGCNNSQQQHLENAIAGTFRFEPVKDWPGLANEYKLGNPTGIGIDTGQNIFVFHRAGREWPLLMPMPKSFITGKTIFMLERQTGKLLNSWGDGIFIMPHGLTVDRDNNVWVTDVGLHQVFKFSHEGALLMKLGEAGVAGKDALHFNLPTDVAVAPDGSFYVSDGYGNSRVMKFSPSGKYLLEWGKKGSGPGEFNIPHAIDLDKKGNVYVADRENSRIQSFDTTGHFIKEWKKKDFGKIYSVAIGRINSSLTAVDYNTGFFNPKGSDIMVLDSAANLLTRFGRSGINETSVCRYHDIAIDNEESIYVGDILGNTIRKFHKVTVP